MITADPQSRRPWLDPLLAVAVGVLFAVLAEYVVAPQTIRGGSVTGSDPGEHFWMLHALAQRGWEHFSHNRYPLPTLAARLVCTADNPYGCWRQAAFVSTAVIGGSIWLWARVLAGRAAGFAAAVLALAFPELVLVVRMISAYPEILAIWTASGALAAHAWVRPSWPAALLAGVGAGAVLASDPRGLLVALAIVPVLLAGGLRAGWRGLVAAVLPIVASWGLQSTLSLVPLSLEDEVESAVEVSWTRAGLRPPERIIYNEGYAWGRSSPLGIPGTLRALASTQARMNPGEAELPQQRVARKNRFEPLMPVAGVLLLGLPLALRRRPIRALALLPAGPMLFMLYNAWKLEYHDRFAALGMTGCAVLCGAGVVGFFDWRPRGWDLRWIGLLLAILLTFALPTSFRVGSPARLPIDAQADLQRCLQGAQDPALARDECVMAMRFPWRPLALPWE